MLWLAPTVGYIVTVGAIGVVAKVALRYSSWPSMVIWATAAYMLVSIVLLVSGAATLRLDRGGAFGFLAGGLAVAALICLYVALQFGPASRIVPISSIYPAITVLLASFFLREHITTIQAAGVCVIVIGAILVTMEAG
jgi:transporter family protein